MTLRALEDFLREVIPTVTQIPAHAPRPQTPDIEFPEEIRLKTETLLRQIPELRDIEEQTLCSISWSSGINYFRLAIAILERLSLGDNPQTIILDIIDLATRETVPTYYLAGIGGINLPNRLQIADAVSIISANDIPPSGAREFVFRLDRFGRIAGNNSHESLRPQAALMVSNDQQVLIPKNSGARLGNRIGMDRIRELERQVLFCLTLASETAAPVYTAKTSWIDHPAHPYHGLVGYSGGTSPAQQYPMSYASFDADLVKRLFNDLKRVKENDRTTLELAAERLRRSRLHAEPVNRAIDLGTALEIVLLHSSSSNQELGYRAAIRAAHLIGTTDQERRSIYDTVHTAYGAFGSGSCRTVKEADTL